MLCTLLSLEESYSICETDGAAYYGTNLKTQFYPTVSHFLVLVQLATEVFQEIRPHKALVAFPASADKLEL